MSSNAKFKFIFVGDGAVGKTSLIARFVYDSFDEAYVATIGMDLISKRIHVDDKPVRLQLWDTAGQERFRALIPSYFRDANVSVIVYDVVDRRSFEATSSWAEEVRRERGDEILIALVGNKIDLVDMRQVSYEEGQAQAEQLNATFFEASAKTGQNVKELFRAMAKRLLEEGVEGAGAANEASHSLTEPTPPPPDPKKCSC
uniref:Uncharacterized protein n=1 Tax=Chromera velia CCMP2878 TaxID=1169474 RepID=A0A0G4GE03_9ALVE|mmetsp:Transcript_48277/g.95304  ORF Transcript_48277/g.95304 Transcript_48277/m.95304 type:complete len:201 (+) Transcript_48277:163-765(+)|eukprot:Cvel_4543.t1-p1 / transcript=Cvel_4543.t1 / gene=Cvel_4543 / organism=Chromera_velia_CCMP2878 / gene_product=Ras-related protein RABH1b, putative / transcript_product=Ras-related protein RABH1b, putative / location=Cvel_scaffold199:42989-46090(-) / protein_length=200 / sequence_SO=supercontig / SO=protein_coding / is_pseudo=false